MVVEPIYPRKFFICGVEFDVQYTDKQTCYFVYECPTCHWFYRSPEYSVANMYFVNAYEDVAKHAQGHAPTRSKGKSKRF